MSNIEQQLSDMRNDISTKQARYTVIRERRDELLATLRKKFTLKNVSAAKEKLAEIESEKKELNEKIGNLVKQIQEDLGGSDA